MAATSSGRSLTICEISQMVSDKPDEVAAMLRGWLTETPSKS